MIILRGIAILWMTCLISLAVLAAELQPIRIGLYQTARKEMTRKDLREAMTLWSKELSIAFKLPVAVVFFEEPNSLRAAFDKGEINAVSADALTLARHFKIAELTDGYSALSAGSWNLVLMTGNDSPIQTLKDIAGKRVALIEDDPLVAFYLEVMCLKQFARECSAVFSEIQRVPTSSQALIRVFFGQTDLALVYRHGFELARELNPQLDRKVGRVIEELSLDGAFYAFFNTKVNENTRLQALKAVPVLHTYPRGRQLLDLFKIDHLEVVHSTVLKPFVDLDQSYRDMKNHRISRGGSK